MTKSQKLKLTPAQRQRQKRFEVSSHPSRRWVSDVVKKEMSNGVAHAKRMYEEAKKREADYERESKERDKRCATTKTVVERALATPNVFAAVICRIRDYTDFHAAAQLYALCRCTRTMWSFYKDIVFG